MNRQNDLLQPSLRGDVSASLRAPYSTQTGVLAAWFGGPLAAIGFAVLNAHRLGRLRRDALWIAALTVAWVALMYWQMSTDPTNAIKQWLLVNASDLPTRYGYRVLALVYCGIATFMHNQQRRATTMFGGERPNGVVAGLILVAAGFAFEYTRLEWMNE